MCVSQGGDTLSLRYRRDGTPDCASVQQDTTDPSITRGDLREMTQQMTRSIEELRRDIGAVRREMEHTRNELENIRREAKQPRAAVRPVALRASLSRRKSPAPGRLRSQVSLKRFDAVLSVPSPSIELRSRLHSRNRGGRQRAPKLAHERCRQTDDILCHVLLSFLRAASGSGSPCFRGSLVQVLDRP